MSDPKKWRKAKEAYWTGCGGLTNDKRFTDANDTITWEDGKEYPLVKMEISAFSHPFFTGKMKFVDTAGRIDKFNKKFAKFTK